MRERWMMGMVVGLSMLAVVGSVVFASSRSSPEKDASPGTRESVGTLGAPEPGRIDDTRAAEEPSGTAVFDKSCRRCHSLEEAVAFVEEQAADEREGYLTKLLDRHFSPPPEQRPVLVRYLIAEIAAQ